MIENINFTTMESLGLLSRLLLLQKTSLIITINYILSDINNYRFLLLKLFKI